MPNRGQCAKLLSSFFHVVSSTPAKVVLYERISRDLISGISPGKRYEVMEGNKKMSINTWRQQCRAKGGRLATITNANDQKAVEATLKTTRKRVALVGMTRDPKNSARFITEEGKPLSYS